MVHYRNIDHRLTAPQHLKSFTASGIPSACSVSQERGPVGRCNPKDECKTLHQEDSPKIGPRNTARRRGQGQLTWSQHCNGWCPQRLFELHLFLVPDSSSARSHVQRLQLRILSEKGAFRERSLIRASNTQIGTENYT